MKYIVKNRLKGAKTWIRVATCKTFEKAQLALNRMTEYTSDCLFVEWTIEEVTNG